MRMHKIMEQFVSLLTFSILLQGCSLLQGTDERFAGDFIHSTPPAERVISMERYPLEKQYIIYRYGVQTYHPPLFELATPIAKKGRDAVSFLLERLQSADSDGEVHDIVFIFEEMKTFGYYDIRKESGHIEVISNRIATMSSPFWRRVTLASLNSILGP